MLTPKRDINVISAVDLRSNSGVPHHLAITSARLAAGWFA